MTFWSTDVSDSNCQYCVTPCLETYEIVMKCTMVLGTGLDVCQSQEIMGFSSTGDQVRRNRRIRLALQRSLWLRIALETVKVFGQFTA